MIRLTEEVRDKAVKIFWGCSRDQIGKQVLIDPTGLFYLSLKKDNQLTCCSNGWFRKATVRLSSSYLFDRWTILCCMQGRQILDALLAIFDEKRSIVLVGLAGGLNGLDIGEIVVGSRVVSQDLSESYSMTWSCDCLEQKINGIIVSTDSMLSESVDLLHCWEKYGALAVDLESYTLGKYAAQLSFKSSAILLITDRPEDKPFYSQPMSPYDYRHGISRIINLKC